MPDWTKSMQQTFEYYIVDPITWKDMSRVDNVKSCSITWDSEAETLNSATIDIAKSLGECYIRVYMITIQNGVKEKHPMGTFLVQTPSESFDGKKRGVSMDAYSPLLELKESPPPLGYSLLKGENIMAVAYKICSEHTRAPVIEAQCDITLDYDFVANTSDTWLSFIIDLIANAKYTLALDEMGRVLFSPKQETASLQPVRTFDDNNSSILCPEIDMSQDLYGIPNVVEVIYSNGSDVFYSRVVNDDPNSPISTVARGREIIHRVTDPNVVGSATESQIEEYANLLLKELSTLEHTVSYTHGYCPVRIGDCVRLNYTRAGITGVKGKVISQSIKCTSGCLITEKSKFKTKIWG